jgi:hypothetical protein
VDERIQRSCRYGDPYLAASLPAALRAAVEAEAGNGGEVTLGRSWWNLCWK